MTTNAPFEHEVEWIVHVTESSTWTSAAVSSFVSDEVIAMDDVHEHERAERIAAAFALLTAKLEDAAGLAADGHTPSRRERSENSSTA